MMDGVVKLPIQRITAEGRTETEDTIVRELPLTIFLNEEELVTLLCSPSDLESLAVGFLFSEGLLESKDEIEEIIVDDQSGSVRVRTINHVEHDARSLAKPLITSAGKKRASLYPAEFPAQPAIKSQVTVSAGEIITLL